MRRVKRGLGERAPLAGAENPGAYDRRRINDDGGGVNLRPGGDGAASAARVGAVDCEVGCSGGIRIGDFQPEAIWDGAAKLAEQGRLQCREELRVAETL